MWCTFRILRLKEKHVAIQGTESNLQFSVYYPQEIAPETWTRLSVYIFKSTEAAAVINDARDLLKGNRYEPPLVTEVELQSMREIALVNVTLYEHGLRFSPTGQGSPFIRDWERFDFEMRAQVAQVNRFSTGVVAFDVDGVIVADIPISVYITEHPGEKIISTTRSPYQATYCSYSFQDVSIVERIERASELLGLDYLNNVIAARSRLKRSPKLLAMIDDADIFQLFWSEAASQSDYVAKEWRYACKLGRQNFIRPVYWLDPMPSPPQELANTVFGREFGLWIELKYHMMPVQHLNVSEECLSNLWRYGVTTVSDVMHFFETSHSNPNSAPYRLLKHIDELLNALDAVGARLPTNLR
jgi:hypothetical protein